MSDAASKHPRPIDDVFTLPGAMLAWAQRPTRVSVNVADGQPMMPAPWRPRMKLDGAMLYVHPRNERIAVERLRRLPLPRY